MRLSVINQKRELRTRDDIAQNNQACSGELLSVGALGGQILRRLVGEPRVFSA